MFFKFQLAISGGICWVASEVFMMASEDPRVSWPALGDPFAVTFELKLQISDIESP